MKSFVECSWIIVWIPTKEDIHVNGQKYKYSVISISEESSESGFVGETYNNGHDNGGFNIEEDQRGLEEKSISNGFQHKSDLDTEAITKRKIKKPSLIYPDLEEKLKKLIEKFQVDAKITRSYDDDRIQFCFVLENYRVDDLISSLQNNGIGLLPCTSVSVIPASVHFEGPPRDHFIARYSQFYIRTKYMTVN